MSHRSLGVWPPVSMGDYSVPALSEALSVLHAQNSATSFSVGTHAAPSGLAATTYRGAVLDPGSMRAYLVPLGQATSATWHYIDCTTGSIVGYAHGASSLQANAYTGGVYHPTLRRIYLAPYLQSGQSTRHYIDCAGGGKVTPYTNSSLTISLGYSLDPVSLKVYSAPAASSAVASVLDAAGTASTLPLALTMSKSCYGSAYSASQRKIYFAVSCPETGLPYVDCLDGAYKATTLSYTQLASSGAYEGVVYSPVQDRIYMVPAQQAVLPVWHYIDCKSGAMVEYAHGCSGIAAAWTYCSGVYSPATNRIYLVPSGQAASATWHYIDCATGEVVPYLHGTATSTSYSYSHGFYNPILGRVHFTARHADGALPWHYIQEYAPPSVPAHWPAYPIVSN